jgi:predicted acylesterase/phospholipase RssA
MATARVDQGPIPPPAVRYLAFEGGGGKGVVYLGALLAMERQPIGILGLPTDPTTGAPAIPGLLGLSGSSAGAMTAFFVALGVTASDLADILSKPETFNGFYDGPENASLRVVKRNKFSRGRPVVFAARAAPKPGQPPIRDCREVGRDEQAMWKLQIEEFPFRFFPTASTIAGVVAGVGGVGGALLSGQGALAGALPALAAVAGLVTHLTKVIPESQLKDVAQSQEWYAPLVNVLTKNDDVFNDYLYNLLFDRGLFPGFSMRNFLRDQLAERLGRYDKAASQRDLRARADNMTFEEFDQIAGLDFTVTGVNITTGKPQYFNKRQTPKFPVVDAVCISSAFPFAFKPVLTLDCDGVDNGYWVDGGLLDNLPMHAFDEKPDGPLNESIVSLRLEDLEQLPDLMDPDNPPVTDRQKKAKKEADEALQAAKNLSFLSIIGTHLGDVLNSFFYPAEEGQIRTPSERKQTLSLDTTGLKTLEFAPPSEISGPLIREAFDHTYQYFGLDPPAEGSPERSELERMIGLFPPSRSPASASPFPRITQIPPPRV